MKTSTPKGQHEIQWTSRMQLDDLDFADDLVLLSQTQQQMQEKTNSVAAASAAYATITLDGEGLEDVKIFTYLGSVIDEQGGSDADVKARIGKTRTVYLQLKNIWNSKQLSTNTKLSTQNTSDFSAGHYQQQHTVVEIKPDSNGGRNQEESLEVDRTHVEESTQLRHNANPHIESSSPKEKRKTKEHITPGNENRHEKSEQELDGTRKEGPGQSGLENAGRRSMLH
ncbi:unnamed protein product [Schistosoma curassoni]|uniref:Reverse transcriptase domain-containing protein n=1 Tax=Schistosoma curassoni TaxID=6186 RepID=A0A183K5Y6_9TREM|nr:unnamed protein product [Schistosoma curassoni]